MSTQKIFLKQASPKLLKLKPKTKSQAKKNLKWFIKTFEGFDFDTTEEYVYLIYYALNKIYFHDNIDAERITVYPKLNKKKNNPYEGYCEYFNQTEIIRISLSGNYYCGKLFVETILHEMVHAWQAQQWGRVDHGKTFINWEVFLQSQNLKI